MPKKTLPVINQRSGYHSIGILIAKIMNGEIDSKDAENAIKAHDQVNKYYANQLKAQELAIDNGQKVVISFTEIESFTD